jgi:hypothetical protein
MSDRISELAGLIAAQVPGLIDEARDQINEAINAAILSLAITAKWDLDGNNVTISMPVAVRRKFEVVAALEDPNQGKLVLDADGDPMSASVSKALNKFQETMKQHGATVTIQKGVGL